MQLRSASRAPAILTTILGLALAGAVLWQTARYVRDQAIDDIRSEAAYNLDLVVAGLRGELAKFSFQPRLLSSVPAILAAAANRHDPRAVERANFELARITGVTGALATYLMDTEGTTIAASNWALEQSFVGRNFAYRPYFMEAMEGRLGRFFALGTTSGERGYYFSYPVRSAGEISGVVVVKMDVSSLEQRWRSRADEILVIDNDGVIFLSTDPAWLFRTLEPLDAVTRSRIESVRRYPGRALNTLDLERADAGPVITLSGSRVGDSEDERLPGAARNYVTASRDMNEADWHVMILADASGITSRVSMALAIVGFMMVSAVLLAMNILQRRRRLAERLLRDERAKAELETKVSERTLDLSHAVARLEAEVGERQRAEQHLLTTQQELIQASKLAALGNLSAGLSHELNQPLTAIRTYADNARQFLDNGKPETAGANLVRITDLTDRMARIIRNLRTFARNESVSSRPTRLLPAIGNAIHLLEGQIAKAGVTVDLEPVDETLTVIGGDVRLQQVFVNLISNAIDAMAGTSRSGKRIGIGVEVAEGRVTVTVTDTGPGIPADAIDRVFDPFFTTKDVGGGTGLGLSITHGIVESFGGSIAARNAEEGGAVFVVTLLRADTIAEAAE